jgi:hypothetical protein
LLTELLHQILQRQHEQIDVTLALPAHQQLTASQPSKALTLARERERGMSTLPLGLTGLIIIVCDPVPPRSLKKGWCLSEVISVAVLTSAACCSLASMLRAEISALHARPARGWTESSCNRTAQRWYSLFQVLCSFGHESCDGRAAQASRVVAEIVLRARA